MVFDNNKKINKKFPVLYFLDPETENTRIIRRNLNDILILTTPTTSKRHLSVFAVPEKRLLNSEVTGLWGTLVRGPCDG